MVVPFACMLSVVFEISASPIFDCTLHWFNVRCCVRQFAAFVPHSHRFGMSLTKFVCVCDFSFHIPFYSLPAVRRLFFSICTAHFVHGFIFFSFILNIKRFLNSVFFSLRIQCNPFDSNMKR